MAGIYYLRIITSSLKEVYYVGQTSRSFRQRWSEHLRDLRTGQHTRLQTFYDQGCVIIAGIIVSLHTKDRKRLEEVEKNAIRAMRKRGFVVVNET